MKVSASLVRIVAASCHAHSNRTMAPEVGHPHSMETL
jgi:hypothetical protein